MERNSLPAQSSGDSETKTIHVRLSPGMLERIDRMLGERFLHRGEAVRALLAEGLDRRDGQ